MLRKMESLLPYHLTLIRPRNLLDHLTIEAASSKDPIYKQWVVEAEILYIWILDSMNTKMANPFI